MMTLQAVPSFKFDALPPVGSHVNVKAHAYACAFVPEKLLSRLRILDSSSFQRLPIVPAYALGSGFHIVFVDESKVEDRGYRVRVCEGFVLNILRERVEPNFAGYLICGISLEPATGDLSTAFPVEICSYQDCLHASPKDDPDMIHVDGLWELSPILKHAATTFVVRLLGQPSASA